MRFPFAVALMSAVIPMGASAQATGSSDSAAQAAEKAYISENWTEAERQYSELTKQQPENARFWYRLGVSARGDKHFDVALEAMKKAKTLGAGKGLPAFLADYEVATTYAAMGDSARALETLRSSANAGFMMSSRLQNDTEWNSLRRTISSQRWQSRFITIAHRAKTGSSNNSISG